MALSPYTIGRVAAMTYLTVRALHHYDAIGLVCPSNRSPSGYRLYSEDDLRRLQQVLVFRELGFSLEDVRALIDAEPQRKREALLAQRQALLERRERMEAVLAAVDATLHSLERNQPMNTDRLFHGHEAFAHGEYAQEAERRWGESKAWRTSQQRSRAHTQADWATLQTEADAITDEALAAMQQGLATDSREARAIAERHRLHIDRWFYPCSPAMHVQVASLYTADPRFQAHYDRRAPGLAAYLEAAIRANANDGEREAQNPSSPIENGPIDQ